MITKDQVKFVCGSTLLVAGAVNQESQLYAVAVTLYLIGSVLWLSVVLD
jgi:hypothetical protein